MRRFWIVLAGILLLALALTLIAQTGLVRLRITTAKGEAIPQAEVSVLGKNGKAEKIVHANRLGQVALADLPPGPRTLRIEAEGFAMREISFGVEKNGGTKMLEIVLQAGKPK